MEAFRLTLTFEEVTYTRDQFRLTADGTFEEGVHLVSGKVGSGKSTLAFIASGLVLPASGCVHRMGIRKSLLSMQFPEYHTTGITLNDEIRTWGLDPEVILASTRLYGRGEQDIRVLSRGELKRLHLGCVLSADADLLILDEPFSALDCREKRVICRGITERLPGTVIICTHEQTWLPLVDFIWEIKEGTLVSCGQVPAAISRWSLAPRHIRDLLERGLVPGNISPGSVMEAACRTRE
jgi:energy-coupling factor transport system ATP-binding protein